MKYARRAACFLALLSSLTSVSAQTTTSSPNSATSSPSTVIVPRLIRFGGTLRDSAGKSLTGTAGVTFALYKEQEAGQALWIETQNVPLDSVGRYNVLMGATRAEGVPMEVFTSGDARWLEVSVQGQAPQPRVLLVSVPYALKAQEAESLAGKPASQYVSTETLKQQVKQEVQAEIQSGTPRTAQIATAKATAQGATNFSGSTTDQLVSVNQTGTGYGINVIAASNIGVLGLSKGANGAGLYGVANNTGAGTGYGLRGDSYTASGRGMRGVAFGAGGVGVQATAEGVGGFGALVESRATSGSNGAMYAIDYSPSGVAGIFDNKGGGQILSLRTNGVEMASVSGAGTLSGTGARLGGSIQFTDTDVVAAPQTPLLINAVDCCDFGDRMIWAHSPDFITWGIYYDDDADVMHWQEAPGTDLMTLDFNSGNLSVTGAITAGTKDFKIDHPLDPTNKYLYHGSVESSEMMNIYSGNTILDSEGRVVISLPEWFEAVNTSFRYQLTAIGAAAPNLHIAQEIANHQFSIAGGSPGMKVSWQVTGVRHDAYAQAHPLVVEVDKSGKERGHYLHPEAFGAPRLTQGQLRQQRLQGQSKSKIEPH